MIANVLRTRRSVFFLLIALITSLCLSLYSTAPTQALEVDDIIEAGTIKIAVPQDFAPFGSLGENGDPEGYDVDTARLLAEDLGVDLELIPVTSTNRIPFLQTGRADLVISTLGANPERAKSIAFSIPYAPFFSGVYGPADVEVSEPADLEGLTIGVTQGSLEDLELSKIAPEGADFRRFEDNSGTLASLLANQVDVIATGNVIAAQLREDNPDRNIEQKFIMKQSPSHIGMRRGETDLLQWVNTFIYHKRLGGELNEFSLTWLGEELPDLPQMP